MDLSQKDSDAERKKERVLKALRRSLDLHEITPEGLQTAVRKQKRRENKGSKKSTRGPTGYTLYSESVRPAVAQRFDHRDVMSQIAIKWNALPQKDRDAWIEKASKLKLRERSPARSKSPRSSARKSPRSSKRTPKSKGSAKKSKGKRSSGRARKS